MKPKKSEYETLAEYHEACGFTEEDEEGASTASFTSYMQSQMNWKYN
jgi:hypothetical protein